MMVLYQSLIRNLFRALYNLSVSVLLLLASVLSKAGKMPAGGTEGGMLGTGIPGSCSGTTGRGAQTSPPAPQEHKQGPSPQTLLLTGC